MAKFEGYLPVSSSENDTVGHTINERPGSKLRKILQGSALALGALGALGLGYSLGSRHAHAATPTTIRMMYTVLPNTSRAHILTVPAGGLHYYMQFNKTFPQRPDKESDAAWASLFPDKLGFVQHPELAPNVAGIAVFHELHCLASSYLCQCNSG